MQPMRLGRRLAQGAALTGVLLLLLDPSGTRAESPSPLPPYVPDELMVKFFSPPSDTELEIFEVKYLLEHVRPMLAPGWHMFRIQDGADAALKAEWVGQDPLVCAVQLSFLGEWAATNRDLEDTECNKPPPDDTPSSAEASSRPAASDSPASSTPPASGVSNPLAGGTPLALALLVIVAGAAVTAWYVGSVRRRMGWN